jgi:hypothetical protein
MKRMQVKSIGGKFNYICSTEFVNGLIDDPRVKLYMELEQTTGKLYGSGEPFDLFELQFIPTMLDEFAYPDTEFPGVYELADGNEVIRLYAIDDTNTQGKYTVYYLDVHQDFVVDAAGTKAKHNTGIKYLPDGTAVDDGWIKWELPVGKTGSGTSATPIMVELKAENVGSAEASSTKVKLMKTTKTVAADANGIMKATYDAVEASTDYATVRNLIAAGAFAQLPVHRGILFGDEALVKLSVEGVSDAPRIIIKALGSSGVTDPLDQRQSVGFRVDGFGLAIKRPEALCVTYGIPANAELSALTASAIYGDYTVMTNYGLGNDSDMSGKANEIVYDTNDSKGTYQALNVDGINDVRIFLEFDAAKSYSQGTVVVHEGKYYVFTSSYKGNKDNNWSNTAGKVKEIRITNELPILGEINDETNIK